VSSRGGIPGGKFNMSNPKSEIEILMCVAAATPGAGEYNPKSPTKYDSNYKDRVPSSPSKFQQMHPFFEVEPHSGKIVHREPLSPTKSKQGSIEPLSPTKLKQ
jgi:hypothetical protein